MDLGWVWVGGGNRWLKLVGRVESRLWVRVVVVGWVGSTRCVVRSTEEEKLADALQSGSLPCGV